MFEKLLLVLLGVVSVVYSQPILVDLSFGPTLSGSNILPTIAPSIMTDISLKSDGSYNGCGFVGNAALVGQVTSSGNLDVLNFNAPTGYLAIAIQDFTTCYSMLTQPGDQKTVIAGYVGTESNLLQMMILRLTPAGALDTSNFGSPNGYTLIDIPTIDSSTDQSLIQTIRIQSDNYIVGGGTAAISTTPDIFQMAVVRVDPMGILDPAFGTSGIQTIPMGDSAITTGMQLQSDGKIIILANVVTSGVYSIGIARLTPAGDLDTTYGSSGTVSYTALSNIFVGPLDIQYVGANQDKIIVTAYNSPSGQVYILRFATDGSLDTSFGSSGILTVNLASTWQPFISDVVVAQDGTDNLLIGGQYETNGLSFLLKLSADGTPDPTFGNGQVAGLLQVNQLVVGNAVLVQAVDWDLNSMPVVAGQSDSSILLQRYLTTNTPMVSFVSPAPNSAQPSTTDVQAFINGGSTIANYKVNVLIDNIQTFAPVTNSRGNWVAGLSAPLSPGTHIITANLVYDVADIIATSSTNITITI